MNEDEKDYLYYYLLKKYNSFLVEDFNKNYKAIKLGFLLACLDEFHEEEV